MKFRSQRVLLNIFVALIKKFLEWNRINPYNFERNFEFGGYVVIYAACYNCYK